MNDKFEQGEVVFKGKEGEPIPDELQELVDKGEALVLRKVENRWTGFPRTIAYALLVGAFVLYVAVGTPLSMAIGFGITMGVALGITWQFTGLTKAYTKLRNLFEEHRAFSSMINKAMISAVADMKGTFEDEIGLSTEEDSSDTVH